MPDQSQISNGGLGDFGLIETLLWTPDEGFHLLAEHFARLRDSAERLGFVLDKARARAALASAIEASAPRLRVRLVLQRDGAIETSVTQIEPIGPETLWRVRPAQRRFSSSDPMLRHKTTRRALYEEALAASEADEVLFQNERGEVCEGARANVFLPRAGALLTPPLSCGLLPGTLRAHLLSTARAREETLILKQFEGVEFFMGNSVRGLVRARLAT